LTKALIITEPGIALQNRKGSLCVHNREGVETHYPARIHGLKTIVLAGLGSSITSEALRWCAREGVALYVMERSGEFMALLTEATEGHSTRATLAIRQKQFKTVSDQRKRLEVAKKIVGTKLRTLGLHPVDAAAFRAEIVRCKTILDLMAAEARAGGAYFLRFRGREMQFHDDVPEHWRVFVVRAAPKLQGLIGTSKARNAATPIGAMLNYSYAVGLGQCTRAVVGAGLDPCFGLLHGPRQGRLSLSYDVLEFHRAKVTEGVFRLAGKRVWIRNEFEFNARGVVRCGATAAREVAWTTLKTVTMTEVERSVKRIVGWM
jgi:CRISPR-associated protein Cas1